MAQEEDESRRQCRICHSGSPPSLIRPCSCRGTMKYVHAHCAEEWVLRRLRAGTPTERAAMCEICRESYAHVIYSPHPFSFLLSFKAWRRWAHLAYMLFIGRRYASRPSVLSGYSVLLHKSCDRLYATNFQQTVCFFLIRMLSVRSASQRIVHELRVAVRVVNKSRAGIEGSTKGCGSSRGALASSVAFSLLMATHYAVFLVVDARHLFRQYRKWRASSANVFILDKAQQALPGVQRRSLSRTD